MAIRLYNPTTAGRRGSSALDYTGVSRLSHKNLAWTLSKKSGRNASGKVTTHHQGGRHKRFYREIDWKRDKKDVIAKIMTIEYDPNRTANIALVQYSDGERRYILSPEGLVVGKTIMSGEAAPLTIGNALPLRAIPVGTLIHNIEIVPGKGGQLARGAGSAAIVSGFEEKWALVKMPSGEVRRFLPESMATIGQLGNLDWKNVNFGKAGRKRNMGIRPTVRGTAQNPHSHPHGGGEGRSGEGMHPKTPWGKSARGNRTRNKTKYSNRLVVERRKN
jgi:large subunit ribosomal protein L2